MTRVRIILPLAALLFASQATLAQQKGFTKEEAEKWLAEYNLTDELEADVRGMVRDVEGANPRISPFFTGGRVREDRHKEALEKVKAQWAELEKLQGKLAPLKAAVARIEGKWGTSNDAIEKKFFATYGTKIVPRERGFSRMVNAPARTHWLPVNKYPFAYYEDAKKVLTVATGWKALVLSNTARELKERVANYEEKVWTSSSYTAYPDLVKPEHPRLKALEDLIAPAEAVIKLAGGTDAAISEGIAGVKKKAEEITKRCAEKIDATPWPEEVKEFSGDIDATKAGMLKALSEEARKDLIAIQITDDYKVYDKDLLLRPVQYSVWAKIAYKHEERGDKDLARVEYTRFLTEKVASVKPEPPFRTPYVRRTYLMRPGNVPGGGGFLSLLLGFCCCTFFLVALGGGAYVAYTKSAKAKEAMDGVAAKAKDAAEGAGIDVDAAAAKAKEAAAAAQAGAQAMAERAQQAAAQAMQQPPGAPPAAPGAPPAAPGAPPAAPGAPPAAPGAPPAPPAPSA